MKKLELYALGAVVLVVIALAVYVYVHGNPPPGSGERGAGCTPGGAPCAASLVCVASSPTSGTCAPCAADGDCPSGRPCVGGVCVAAGKYPKGKTCTPGGWQCAAPLVCGGSPSSPATSGTCGEPGAGQTQCKANHDCASGVGQRCFEGRCVKTTPGEFEKCVGDADCKKPGVLRCVAGRWGRQCQPLAPPPLPPPPPGGGEGWWEACAPGQDRCIAGLTCHGLKGGDPVCLPPADDDSCREGPLGNRDCSRYGVGGMTCVKGGHCKRG
jgi:hypothetical protein